MKKHRSAEKKGSNKATHPALYWRHTKVMLLQIEMNVAVGSGQWAVGSGQWAVGSGQKNPFC
ncbi:MAG: hypothetical protein OEY29_12685 [Gammaproteobacteria bacterium]|nr:hypothetical protein [Gammaproteobacteria bacterium]